MLRGASQLVCAFVVCVTAACGDDPAESGTDGAAGASSPAGMGPDSGAGTDMGADTDMGAGTDTGAGTGADSDDGADPGADEDRGADMGAEPSGVCAACDGSCMEELVVESAAHVSGPIDYPDTPPAGGMHDPCWADYAVYDDPALPAERWVHNLEHGAVVFLYRCDSGCADEVAQLEGLVVELPRTILTPYAEMPEGFAAVAWGRRLVASCFDLEAMRAFHAEAFDRAPESVPSGAPSGCP